MPKFIIEDDLHAELQGEFATLEEVLRELRRRAEIPWDQEPNVAPCQGWATCGRIYVIYEVEVDPDGGWRELRHGKALEISKDGVVWHETFNPSAA